MHTSASVVSSRREQAFKSCQWTHRHGRTFSVSFFAITLLVSAIVFFFPVFVEGGKVTFDVIVVGVIADNAFSHAFSYLKSAYFLQGQWLQLGFFISIVRIVKLEHCLVEVRTKYV
jgi:hypothetical protein